MEEKRLTMGNQPVTYRATISRPTKTQTKKAVKERLNANGYKPVFLHDVFKDGARVHNRYKQYKEGNYLVSTIEYTKEPI